MKRSRQFHVAGAAAFQRLDEFLAARLGWLSRMHIANLLAEGACAVDGARAHAGHYVRAGNVVEIILDEAATTAMLPERMSLEIIYEDEDLLVVVKPAGMLVHPTRGVKSGTLANALAYHLNKSQIEASASDDSTANPKFEISELKSESSDLRFEISDSKSVVRPGLAHRLDRATSGLMVVAKNQRALSILSRHFRHRLVEKRYLALVHGRVVVDECVINAPIGRDALQLPQWRVMTGGKAAETRLSVLESRERLTLVELEPVTGRTNQLRIHSAHIGHPIIGDSWYGNADEGARLCLHAARLGFKHPVAGKWVHFQTPLPADLSAYAGKLHLPVSL